MIGAVRQGGAYLNVEASEMRSSYQDGLSVRECGLFYSCEALPSLYMQVDIGGQPCIE